MKTIHRLILLAPAIAWLAAAPSAATQPQSPLLLSGGEDGTPVPATRVHPLDTLAVAASAAGSVEVRDGAGKVYFRAPLGGQVSFRAGGALGEQAVIVRDPTGAETGRAVFSLDADTTVDDGGKYRDMFNLFRSGMNAYSPDGVETAQWNGRTYHYFVNWVLDNYHTGKGMRYFSPYMTDLLDMMRDTQREDGMIWSNLNMGATAYYKTAYGPFGYVRQYGDRYFVRQPAENHPEYVYVSSIYQSWKANGDDAWMGLCLPSAMRALDYCVIDPARWSRRFLLLKRVYTIDSWDFQVDDKYTPDIGLTNTMLIDPQKSKFGVFFGDNVYYAAACEELAEMLGHAGDTASAARYSARAGEIRRHLDALSWNGHFFTHFIEEDPAVRRDLGVDEWKQIAQGNAYSLNRGVDREHAVEIIRTYLELRGHLPPGSPGEWYAIYPPFQRGFGGHDAVWQYMNGGVGGHVAGELSRGAFENGFESYGRDILDRLADLGRRYGNKIWFAYTGSIPPAPPPPHYTPIDLSAVANMDTWDKGGPGAVRWMVSGKGPGDDIRGLPTGDQQLAGIDFKVADPQGNQRRSAVAVSHLAGLPASADVPVNVRAGCIYLLHTSTKPGSEKVCGSVAFNYADATHEVQYLTMGRHLTYWWFPELKTDFSGIAWHGPSPVSDDVGLSWCAIDNPHPEKTIATIRFRAPDDDGIYVVLGLTLADRAHDVPPNPVSFGGPDNWAAATAMAALIEGMAGVKDAPLSQAFSHPVIAPRWDLGESRAIRVTVRYPASRGYAAYRFANDPRTREVTAAVTCSGASIDGHFLLPPGSDSVKSVEVDGAAVPFRIGRIGESSYVDLRLENSGVHTVRIRY